MTVEPQGRIGRSRQSRRKLYESKRWLARLSAVESPNVTYYGENFPIVVRKARGLRVRDVDGNSYTDFSAFFGVAALGHNPPAVASTVRKQMAQLVHGLGDVHPSEAKIKLLEKVAALTGIPQAKGIFGLSGSDAVEAALKTAMVATGRSRFLAFAGGYHGLSFGPLALSDRLHFRQGFESWLSSRVAVMPFPSNLEISATSSFACLSEAAVNAFNNTRSGSSLAAPHEILSQIEQQLKLQEFAAIVVEPVQGRGGDRTFPAEFLKSVAFLARKYGTLLILDEVFTGFGRTGSLFAFEAEGIVPDLICLGKALGGGFPLSLCMGAVMDAWGKSNGEARHTSTFLGHPLACAVGYRMAKEIGTRLAGFNNELLAINREIELFVTRCREAGVAARYPFVVTGRGFMRGLYFPLGPDGIAAKFAEKLLGRGFLVLPSGADGNVLSLTPPLIVTRSEFRKLFNTLAVILAE